MKTRTSTRYETAIQKWRLGWWNDETEELVPYSDTEEGQLAAAEALGVPVKLIESLQMSGDDLRDFLRIDLVDIWRRQDVLEARIEALEKAR